MDGDCSAWAEAQTQDPSTSLRTGNTRSFDFGVPRARPTERNASARRRPRRRAGPSFAQDDNHGNREYAVVMAWQQKQTKNLQPSPLADSGLTGHRVIEASGDRAK